MTANLERHISLLGLHVRDKVTKFEGVVTHVGFDINGCIQAIVAPRVQGNNELKDVKWFDVLRLEVVNPKPVIDQPDFDWSPEAISGGLKGPCEKPEGNEKPII